MCIVALGSVAVNAATPFDEMAYTPQATTFTLSHLSRQCKAAVVNLYEQGQGGAIIKAIKLKPVKNGAGKWAATVKGDWKGKYYTFCVDLGKGMRGETAGVVAKAVGVNGQRAAIVDLRQTNPEGWNTDRPIATLNPADLVIYELHYRDFSMSDSVDIKRRGKFLALTEPWALEYLKDLGVNAVHVLPSFDFASIDESNTRQAQYNWGYDPLNYNVPEGSYATNAADPLVRIHEFKEMVMALHKAGIRVIMDVVYNHVSDAGTSSFEQLYPGMFFRKTKEGGYSNGTGCGNEMASERPLVRQYIIQSVKYWASEYHVDGFRFDLMGAIDVNTMNEVRQALKAINPHAFIYGEGWSAGKCGYPVSDLAVKDNMLRLSGIAAYSDELRDALRGPFGNDRQGGFVAGVAGFEERIKAGIVGCIEHPQVDYSKVTHNGKPWALEPVQMIAYASCHDDLCLADRLRSTLQGIEDDELIRLDEMAQAMVLTSQGVPSLFCGEEVLRTKQGLSDTYNAPDSVNAVNWGNLNRYKDVHDFYKGLIQLRHNHPAFRLGNAKDVRERLQFLPVQDGYVGYVLKDHAGGDAWNNIIVLFNANLKRIKVAIPSGQYTIVAIDGRISENGLGTMRGGNVELPPQSTIILHD